MAYFSSSTQSITLGQNRTITATFSPSTGLNRVSLSVVVAYPNPFNSNLTLGNTQGVRRVVVTNLLGHIVAELKIEGQGQVVIPSDRFARGMYIINLYSLDGHRDVRRVVKE